MLARLLIVVGLLLSASLAPATMAHSRQAGPSIDHGHAASMSDMPDCGGEAPADRCKQDCAFCHGITPAVGLGRVGAVSYAAPRATRALKWQTRTVELDPPVPRHAS